MCWSSLARLRSWVRGADECLMEGKKETTRVRSAFATLTQQRCLFFFYTVFPQYLQGIGFKPAHPVQDKIHRRSSSLCVWGACKGRASNCTNFPLRFLLKRRSLTRSNVKEGNRDCSIILMTASSLFKTKIASLFYNYKSDTCTFSKIQAIQNVRIKNGKSAINLITLYRHLGVCVYQNILYIYYIFFP